MIETPRGTVRKEGPNGLSSYFEALGFRMGRRARLDNYEVSVLRAVKLLSTFCIPKPCCNFFEPQSPYCV